MEDLKGRLVMIHPNLTHDPMNQQGEVGIIVLTDLTKDEVYVGLGNGNVGLYSTDALLMLKPSNVIYADIMTNFKKLDTPDFKTLMEITLLQDKSSLNYQRDAVELAATNEVVLSYSTVPMQKALGLTIEGNQIQSNKGYMNKPLADVEAAEVVVDQKAFNDRVNKGKLPTIEICGHTFFVDITMDKLRPKDDFLSKGISFSDIEDYFNDTTGKYLFPYNPQKKELGNIDYETITEIPKDLVVVEIPSELKMDPIGWNRKHGYDLTEGLAELGLQMNFTAKEAKWEDIFVPQKIQENLGFLEKSKRENQTNAPTVDPQENDRRKGRRM